jgi:hypothetical protein
MGRIRRGWDLTKKAWGVVRANPGLLKLPVLGGIFAFIAFVVFAGPGVAILASSDQPSNAQYAGGGALILIGSYLASFSVIYFNVALAAAANGAFQGGEASSSAGLAVARQRVGVIAAWAAVAGVVSLFFALLRQEGGLLGTIASAVGAALWSLITFLIVPVLAFEGLGPFAAIKRSGSLFKSRWGEQITGDIAIGAITGLVAIAAILVGVAGVFIVASGSTAAIIAGGGLVLLGLVALIIAIVVSGAVRGVFGVALYHYVAESKVVGPFTNEDLERAVKPSKNAKPAAI